MQTTILLGLRHVYSWNFAQLPRMRVIGQYLITRLGLYIVCGLDCFIGIEVLGDFDILYRCAVCVRIWYSDPTWYTRNQNFLDSTLLAFQFWLLESTSCLVILIGMLIFVQACARNGCCACRSLSIVSVDIPSRIVCAFKYPSPSTCNVLDYDAMLVLYHAHVQEIFIATCFPYAGIYRDLEYAPVLSHDTSFAELWLYQMWRVKACTIETQSV